MRTSVDCRNVNDTYTRLMGVISQYGVVVETRNGLAKTLPHPLAVLVRSPWERVLFDPARNANPFFHLVEALWMLAGRNDVEYIAQFNARMRTYSDDGETFNAAYGHRWRKHFGVDQLLVVIEKLKRNPLDRQAIISMWDPTDDLTNPTTLDRPCNTQIMPRIHDGELSMMTVNRSNDVVFGLTGANAVHLTILQEFLARAIGVKMGPWNHFSNNAHIYEMHWGLMNEAAKTPYPHWYPYSGTQPLLAAEESHLDFLQDCSDLCDGQDDDFRTRFFDETVAPMVQGWHKWRRDEDLQGAIYDASCVEANDWRLASVAWLKRKVK